MTRNVLRDRQQWARHGMVTTASPLASVAALEVLREGGTAFDAAITASAVLTVALPMASGPGGDAAAILHVKGSSKARALTALGRTPAAATVAVFREAGLNTIPHTGPLSVSTPGLIDGWLAVHRTHGTLPLSRLLGPAIDAAREGVVVTGQVGRWTADNLETLEQQEFLDLYRPFADPSAVGSVMRQPGLASLFELIADLCGDPDAMRKTLGEAVAEASRSWGGLVDAHDLLRDQAELAEAMTLKVAGHLISTTPAPTQGPLLLQNLALFETLGSGLSLATAEGIHLLTEIVNQTYGWRLENLGDPEALGPVDAVGAQTLSRLAAGVRREYRSDSLCIGRYSQGDTSQFAIIDGSGNAVSWIQSLGAGFGAGVGVPELGLLLSDRLGRSVTLNEAEPNSCAPGRRPVNTIMAWSVSSPEELLYVGGTPGGDGQTQWNAQVLLSLLSDGAGALSSLGRPRWTYYPGCDKFEADRGVELRVDADLDERVIAALSDLGHPIVRKASVGGVMRLLGRSRESLYGLDDGRHEGLTVGY